MIGRILHWICRLVLGAIFLYAGYSKGLYPREEPFLFSMAVSAYQLLPEGAVVTVARLLPWLEVVLGLVLILGWKLRYTSAFCALLLAGFIGAMAYTYSRGIEVDCACFGIGEPISPTTLARDSVFLVLAIFLAVYAWRARPLATASAA